VLQDEVIHKSLQAFDSAALWCSAATQRYHVRHFCNARLAPLLLRRHHRLIVNAAPLCAIGSARLDAFESSFMAELMSRCVLGAG